MSYQIERDIPPPPRGPNGGGNPAGRPREYPFGEMMPGDSVLITGKAVQVVRVSLSSWKRGHPGQSFSTRAEADGVRVWRTA